MRKPKDNNHNSDKRRDNVLGELFCELPEFNLRGNKEVVIEGSRGVLEYTQELIRINTPVGLVCFFGRGLNLKCISSSELIINGFILKVEFIQ